MSLGRVLQTALSPRHYPPLSKGLLKISLLIGMLLSGTTTALFAEPFVHEAGLFVSGRLGIGYDRILGVTVRPEAGVEYVPFEFLELDAGAASLACFGTDFVFSLVDSAYLRAEAAYRWEWIRVGAETAATMTYLPFTSTWSLSLKGALLLELPYVELAGGINYRSYPTGLWDAEFLFKVGLVVRLDEERLTLRLAVSDYDDYTEGSLATIKAMFEARYDFGFLEAVLDVDIRTAGTVAFSGTMSRLLIGLGARSKL